jgi:hypothetical protein
VRAPIERCHRHPCLVAAPEAACTRSRLHPHGTQPAGVEVRHRSAGHNILDWRRTGVVRIGVVRTGAGCSPNTEEVVLGSFGCCCGRVARCIARGARPIQCRRRALRRPYDGDVRLCSWFRVSDQIARRQTVETHLHMMKSRKNATTTTTRTTQRCQEFHALRLQ